MPADGLLQKPSCGLWGALVGAPTVQGRAVLVDSALERGPLPLHGPIRLLPAPTGPAGPRALGKGVLAWGALGEPPPVHGGVVHVQPTGCPECLDGAGAQRVRHRPAPPPENDLWGDMGPLKTDGHRRAPSSITVGQRARSYRKSPHLKIGDITGVRVPRAVPAQVLDNESTHSRTTPRRLEP